MIKIFVFLSIILLVVISIILKKINEYERGVILRFGKFIGIKKPGIRIVVPFVDALIKIDQRLITMDIPSQDVITKDNVSVKVNAVVYFKVIAPEKAILTVADYYYATSQLAQTTLRSVCGEAELDGLLSNREEFNLRIQEILDKQTDPWGIKVTLVEVKHIDLPQEMQRAMAKEAEAERERRAKIIKAQGEFQASEKLTEAATIMSKNPLTIQLRYLETLRNIGVENNSTIVFPLPIELMNAFKKYGEK